MVINYTMLLLERRLRMDLNNEKYIILEIIPTSSDPKKGDIAQLSALKVDGIKILDRFDYRLSKDKINNEDILRMTDYDNDSFKYVKTTKTLVNKFKKFIGDLPLLIIDNEYTNNYLEDFDNKKESIFKYYDLEVTFDCFDKLIQKYELEPSNYLVDLLFEALIRTM